MAPGYTLEEIWAALPPPELAAGMAFSIIWIVFWAAAILVYLAGAVFFQFFASFGIGMSTSDTFPPYVGGGSDIRAWYAIPGQLSLVASLVLSIAPRPLATAAPHPV